MPQFALPLLEKKELATGTMAFQLGLPGAGWAFKPGQFVNVTLVNPPYQDAKGNGRSFSIASAPGEPFLMIATRMTNSAFKRGLAELSPGATVQVRGPYGPFGLGPDPAKPVALFAGGIGITPFRSMIKHALAQHAPLQLTLVYSNRTPEDAAFLDDLVAWSDAHPNFRLVATMTQPEKSQRGWTGRTGYVDAALVKDTLGNPAGQDCYVAGPPRFVAAVAATLAAAGVSKDAIHTDEFDGY